MGVTIGIKGATDLTGFSNVTPKPDSSFTTWAAQFGTDYNGDGTRFIFCASSGNDGNKGTKNSPVKTSAMLDAFYGKMRDGMPDWFLFRRADTIIHNTSLGGTNLPFGPSGDPSNLATFYPMVITNYDDAAPNNPPLFDPVSGGALPIVDWDGVNNTAGFGSNGGRGKNKAIAGIDFTASLSDPTSPNYTGASFGGVWLTCSASPITNGFLLIENCGLAFASFGANGNPGSTPGANDSWCWLRRNRIKFNAGQGYEGGNCANGPYIHENLFYTNAVALNMDCTFTLGSPGTVTSNGLYNASDPGVYFGNGKRVKFYPVGAATLPSPLEAGAPYWMVNSWPGGAHTFQIALTVGGAPIALSGGSGTVVVYGMADSRLHQLYGGGGSNATPHFCKWDLDGNIFADDGDGGSFIRSGIRVHNNFFSGAPVLFAVGNSFADGTRATYSYNVGMDTACAFSTAGSHYQYDLMNLGPVDFDHNICAHGNGYGVNHAMQYERASHGGVSSHNIVYDWGDYGTGFELHGALLTMAAVNGGTGGDGRVANFYRAYTEGSGGTQSVGSIVGGSLGANGTYPDVTFTGGSGANAKGNVIVTGGAVTQVQLTFGGDLNYVAGDTLTAAFSGAPAGWSFKIYPYIVELRENGTSWSGQLGTGCRAYCIVTFNGKINAMNLFTTDGGADPESYTFYPPYLNTGMPFLEDFFNPSGSVKLLTANPGTQYSSGQVIKPYSLVSGGPPGATISSLPVGFSLTVGPYPAVGSTTDSGLAITGNVSGSGLGSGGEVWLRFQTVSGVTTATIAEPFYKHNNAEPGGANYVANDVFSIANYAGMSGVTLRANTVSSNTDDGTNDYNNAGKTWHTNPYPDPNRTAGTYMTSIGNPGGFASTRTGFFKAVDKFQRKSTWDSRLTAYAFDSYVRFGFGTTDPTGGQQTLNSRTFGVTGQPATLTYSAVAPTSMTVHLRYRKKG